MKRIVLAFSLGLMVSRGYAEVLAAEGFYSSNTTHLQVMVLDSEKGIVAAKTSVNQGHCSGNLAGIGKISGKVLKVNPYEKVEGSEKCSLIVEFDNRWRSATINENEYCTSFHGASCGWEGQAVTKRPNKR